jgi:hypothetical protein
MWSPENSPSKTLVAPPPEEAAVAEVRPAIIKPNHESQLADVNISATRFPSQTPMMPASTTSPLVVRGPEQIKQVPTTASAQVEPPTPARVVSLSDVQVQGPVVIPFANQAAPASSPGVLVPRQTDKASGQGDGNAASKQSGVGPGDGSGDRGGTVAKGAGSSGAQGGTNAVSLPGTEVGSLTGNEPFVTHLTLPKDGQFGVVVVGSSLAEKYPETVEIWSGRLTYTVYLHVGLHKNWILQYSLPPAQEAAVSGTIRPEAPWPYDITTPHLPPDDFNSDALLVHGFINLAGRFERLAMVFPPGFAQAKFVLDALKQWEFRPARQNGQPAAVEVLLIIPEEPE